MRNLHKNLPSVRFPRHRLSLPLLDSYDWLIVSDCLIADGGSLLQRHWSARLVTYEIGLML